MEEIEEVKTFRVNYRCQKCKIGNMIPTGMCYASYPVKYQHKCNECDNVETLDKKYPFISYK